MIEVYESPDAPLTYKTSIFLAGGIDRAPDWQENAISYLREKYNSIDLDVLNPRRATIFSKDDYDSHLNQVRWEFNHLRKASVILFWFPDNAPCTTSLFELGFWLSTSKVVLGINPGHYKEKSIKTQVNLLNSSRIGLKVEVSPTLEETLDNAIKHLINKDLRSSSKKESWKTIYNDLGHGN